MMTRNPKRDLADRLRSAVSRYLEAFDALVAIRREVVALDLADVGKLADADLDDTTSGPKPIKYDVGAQDLQDAVDSIGALEDALLKSQHAGRLYKVRR